MLENITFYNKLRKYKKLTNMTEISSNDEDYYTNYDLYKGDMVYMGYMKKEEKISFDRKLPLIVNKFNSDVLKVKSRFLLSSSSSSSPSSSSKESTSKKLQLILMNPLYMKGGHDYCPKDKRGIDYSRNQWNIYFEKSIKSSLLNNMISYKYNFLQCDITTRTYFKPALKVNKVLVETLIHFCNDEADRIIGTLTNDFKYHQDINFIHSLNRKLCHLDDFLSKQTINKSSTFEITYEFPRNISLFRAYLREAHNYPRFIAVRLLIIFGVYIDFDVESVDPVKVLRDILLLGVNSKYILRSTPGVARSIMRFSFANLKSYKLENFPNARYVQEKWIETQQALVEEFILLSRRKEQNEMNELQKLFRQKKKEIKESIKYLKESDKSIDNNEYRSLLKKKKEKLDSDYALNVDKLMKDIPKFHLTLPLECGKITVNTVRMIRLFEEKGIITINLIEEMIKKYGFSSSDNIQRIISILSWKFIERYLTSKIIAKDYIRDELLSSIIPMNRKLLMLSFHIFSRKKRERMDELNVTNERLYFPSWISDEYNDYRNDLHILMSTCKLKDFLYLLEIGKIKEDDFQYFCACYNKKFFPGFIKIINYIVPIVLKQEVKGWNSFSYDTIKFIEKYKPSIDKDLSSESSLEQQKNLEQQKEKFFKELTFQLIYNINGTPSYYYRYLVEKYKLTQNQINELYYDQRDKQILCLSSYYTVLPVLEKQYLDGKDPHDLRLNMDYGLQSYLERNHWYPTIEHMNYRALYDDHIYTGNRNRHPTSKIYQIWIDKVNWTEIDEMMNLVDINDWHSKNFKKIYNFKNIFSFNISILNRLLKYTKDFYEVYIPVIATKYINKIYYASYKINTYNARINEDQIKKLWPQEVVKKKQYLSKTIDDNEEIPEGWCFSGRAFSKDRVWLRTISKSEDIIIRTRTEEEMKEIIPFGC